MSGSSGLRRARAHRRTGAFGVWLGAVGAREGLGLGGREAPDDDLVGAGQLRLGARHGDEAARVAGPQRAGTDEALHLVGQGEQTDGVGEVGAPIAGQRAEQPIGVR